MQNLPLYPSSVPPASKGMRYFPFRSPSCSPQPVFMGSAFKNKGVQLLLDGVSRYLPAPTDVNNKALDLAKNEAQFRLPCSPSGPFVGLAFKLEEGRCGRWRAWGREGRWV